jgi:hypothetical protein
MDFEDNSRRSGGICCCVCTFIVGIILFAVSWDSLEPTQYGLTFNSFTGYVDTSVAYTGGRHFIGPGRHFITFPANIIVLEFSRRPGASAAPIDCRTGADQGDSDSGGQPVQLDVSVLLRLRKESLGQIYKSFALQYLARYGQYVRQTVSDVVQKFEPREFWTARQRISKAMEKAIRQTLATEFADVESIQLLEVDFSSKYEASIIGIQLAVQSKTTNEYQMKVIQVYKNIDILQSETEATITAITANAAAVAKLIVNNASAFVFNITQATKSRSYANLQQGLSFTHDEIIRYVKTKAIRQHTSAHLTVGLSNPFATGT